MHNGASWDSRAVLAFEPARKNAKKIGCTAHTRQPRPRGCAQRVFAWRAASSGSRPVATMSWRSFMSRNVAEFRLLACPTSPSSAAARCVLVAVLRCASMVKARGTAAVHIDHKLFTLCHSNPTCLCALVGGVGGCLFVDSGRGTRRTTKWSRC